MSRTPTRSLNGARASSTRSGLSVPCQRSSTRTAQPSTGAATDRSRTLTPSVSAICPRRPRCAATSSPGTQHGPGSLPQERAAEDGYGTVARYGFNVVDYSPLLRAALVNLDAWASEGAEPPPSRVPRVEDGTAVARSAVLDAFDRLGVTTPDPDRLWVVRTVELGPDASRGVGRYPAVEGGTYACLVSVVDDDGNELAGIRLPAIAEPTAAHTGWNSRHPSIGAPEQEVPMARRYGTSSRPSRSSSVTDRATRTRLRPAPSPLSSSRIAISSRATRSWRCRTRSPSTTRLLRGAEPQLCCAPDDPAGSRGPASRSARPSSEMASRNARAVLSCSR